MINPSKPSQLKSRLVLLLIVAMFLSSFLIAWGLRLSGWTPSGSKNLGQLIEPPKDLSQANFKYADGKAYDWKTEDHIWRIVVVPSADCTAACTAMTDTLFRVWETQGRQAERLDVLWFGALPKDARNFRKFSLMQASPKLQAALTQVATETAIPVYLIDPNGYLVMQYRPGFNPSDLRKDLARLLK
jgi:cytochrome oxidase Cu insertion factor (SCO1/SenC/PrrC family)